MSYRSASLRSIVLVLGLLAATDAVAQDYATQPAAGLPAATEGRPEIWVATVHIDGNTGLQATAGHPAEAFPTADLPPGGGLQLTPPDAEGKWRMRAFMFHPQQVIVRAGDVVGLNFVGVQGPKHRIAVEGVEGVIELPRGEVRRVEVQATEPGTIRFASLDRQPSMVGDVIVLPRP